MNPHLVGPLVALLRELVAWIREPGRKWKEPSSKVGAAELAAVLALFVAPEVAHAGAAFILAAAGLWNVLRSEPPKPPPGPPS